MVKIMVTYSTMCHEGVDEGREVVRKMACDTQYGYADKVVMWGKREASHNETFVGVGARSIRKGLVSLGSAECTASGFGLGGIWKSCSHLADEILETRVNVPIPLGGGFVEGNTPPDGVATDQLLGHFTFCCQVELCAYDDDWYRLMEWKSGSSGGGTEGENEGMVRCSRVRGRVCAYTVVTS